MRTILGLGVAARPAAAASSSNARARKFADRIIGIMRWRLPLSWTFHSRTVAQTSKSAVSQVSKPAGAPVVPTCCRCGNRRYSRFGNLRYACFARLPQHHFELSSFGRTTCSVQWFLCSINRHRGRSKVRRKLFVASSYILRIIVLFHSASFTQPSR